MSTQNVVIGFGSAIIAYTKVDRDASYARSVTVKICNAKNELVLQRTVPLNPGEWVELFFNGGKIMCSGVRSRMECGGLIVMEQYVHDGPHTMCISGLNIGFERVVV